MSMIPLLVILGPTASGKSDLAVKIARDIAWNETGGFRGAEIVSADSRQVYRGLDIGTGKITEAEMKGVPHHLLDVADPRRRFTVERYRKLARRAIADIAARGKLPVICGGSGFYIDAVVNDREFPAVKADLELRARLAEISAPRLLTMLRRLDPAKARTMAANNSEKNNARRLIRAIEIARAKPADTKKEERRTSDHYDTIFIGLNFPRQELRARIHDRLLKRLRHGMVAEVSHLHEPRSQKNPHGGISWKRMDELGLEYRYLARFIQGELSRDELIAKLDIEIGRYAKRQMTWFRRNPEIKWFTSPDQSLTKYVKKAIMHTNR